MFAARCIEAFGNSVYQAEPAEFDLTDIITALDDAELAALEDDLNFFGFTGVPSRRILEIMDRAGALEGKWDKLLDGNYRPDIPEPIAFMPRATHRRGTVTRRPLRDLPELLETA